MKYKIRRVYKDIDYYNFILYNYDYDCQYIEGAHSWLGQEKAYITLTSLEELAQLEKDLKTFNPEVRGLVISDNEIVIYDDWLE